MWLSWIFAPPLQALVDFLLKNEYPASAAVRNAATKADWHDCFANVLVVDLC